jgi:hypothetical protein
MKNLNKYCTAIVYVLYFLSSLKRLDDDPNKGRNIVANAKYTYLYFVKSFARRSLYW